MSIEWGNVDGSIKKLFASDGILSDTPLFAYQTNIVRSWFESLAVQTL